MTKNVNGRVSRARNYYSQLSIEEKLLYGATLFVGAVAMLLIGFLVVAKFHAPPYGMSQLGQVGDYFGGILNPAIGLVTIIALFFTIRMQKDELRTAKEDLAETRKILAAQQETANLSRFEATFFSLVKFYLEVVAAARSGKSQGADALNSIIYNNTGDYLLVDLGNDHPEARDPTFSFANPMAPDMLRHGYLNVHSAWQSITNFHWTSVNPVALTLIELLLWLEAQEIPDRTKVTYKGIMNSRIGHAERLLTLYHVAFSQQSWSDWPQLKASGAFSDLRFSPAAEFLFCQLDEVIRDPSVLAPQV